MFDDSAARFWAKPDRMTTPLVALLVDRYGSTGDDPLNWLPEVWVDTIGTDCRVALPDGNLSRLAAGALVITQPDRFVSDWHAFDLCCRMMNSVEDREQSGEHADLADVAWGALESVLLHPPTRRWSPEVVAYVGAVLGEAGINEPPELLQRLGLVKGARPRLAEDPADAMHPDTVVQDAGRQATLREVDDTLKENGRRLIEQFEELGGVLRHGQVDSYVARLKKVFPRAV